MREGDGKMLFVRDRLVVRRGEQIRFVIENAGEFAHDFVVANTAEADICQRLPSKRNLKAARRDASGGHYVVAT